MANFFQGTQKGSPNSAEKLPDPGNQRPQGPAQGDLPDQNAGNHGGEGGDPQVCPADGEHHIQPCPEGGRQEEKIAERGVPGPQRPEAIIKKAQQEPHQKAGQEPLGGDRRRGHPSSRRQLKGCRGSS